MGAWDLFRPQAPYSTFRRKTKLKFDNSGQAGDLVDFPVLVVPDTWNPEVVSTIWVRVPRIEALRDDQHIFRYYGNHHDENFENPEGVWRNGYAAATT